MDDSGWLYGESTQKYTFLIFEFMYLCNPNIQKEEMYDSPYISYTSGIFGKVSTLS